MPRAKQPTYWPTNGGSRETHFRLTVALRRRGRKSIDVLTLARQLAMQRGIRVTISDATFYKAMRGGSATSARGKLIREAAAKLSGRSTRFLFGPADRDRTA